MTIHFWDTSPDHVAHEIHDRQRFRDRVRDILATGEPVAGEFDVLEQASRVERTAVSILPVPGARRFYETHGSSPLLLLIPGAGGAGGVFKMVTEYLAAHYTVATYNRLALCCWPGENRGGTRAMRQPWPWGNSSTGM